MQQNHFKTFSERAITVGDDGVVAGHWVHSVVEHRARRNARTAAVTRTRLRRLNDVGQPNGGQRRYFHEAYHRK
jgi:hypothetical protein